GSHLEADDELSNRCAEDGLEKGGVHEEKDPSEDPVHPGSSDALHVQEGPQRSEDGRQVDEIRDDAFDPVDLERAVVTDQVAAAVDPTMAHGDEVQRVLYELVRPARYVTWEYFSRQRLVASGVLAARGRPASRVLDVGCGSGALSIGLSEGAGVDVVSMDILPARIEAVHTRRSSRTPAATARMRVLQADAE